MKSSLRIAVSLAAVLAAQEAVAQTPYFRFRDDAGSAQLGQASGSTSGTASPSGGADSAQGTPAPQADTATLSPHAATVASGGTFKLTGQTTLASPTWTVSGNPSWMVFNPSGQSYVFSGTAGSVSATTTYPVTVTATSNGTSVSDTANITVQAAPAQSGFPSNMTVRASKPFSISLSDPIFASHTWNVSEYNGRISNPQISAGKFTGTTSAPGSTYGDTYSITAFNERNDYYRAAMTVKPNLTFNQYNNTQGMNTVYNQPVTATFGPVSNAIGNLSYKLYSPNQLPAGLSFDAASLTISGTPTTFGQYSVAIGATDSYDNNYGQLQVNINVALPQDIYFTNRMTSATYNVNFGTQPVSTMYKIPVTIQNVTNQQVSLKNLSAIGDSSDPEAFTIVLSTTYLGNGRYSYQTTHSYAPTFVGCGGNNCVEDYDHGQANNVGQVMPCAEYLSAGYYCSITVGFMSSTTGAKKGNLSVTTQNNTSTIPLLGTVQ